MRTAIFGGTFDPIHIAHLKMAREAAAKYTLGRVLFIPAANPPHKPDAARTGYEDRYRMVELACEGEPLFVPSRLEAGHGRSYSILTIERVRAEMAPWDALLFIIGADAFSEITTWYRWRDVVRAVEFIVVARPGHEYGVPAGAKVHRLDSLSLDVSSSEIRRRLASGEDVAELPERLREYVRERGLYRGNRAGGAPH